MSASASSKGNIDENMYHRGRTGPCLLGKPELRQAPYFLFVDPQTGEVETVENVPGAAGVKVYTGASEEDACQQHTFRDRRGS